jgi:fucose 4-O-acetylase-like acetyltransferase
VWEMEKDNKLSNAKGVLILFVVFGHVIEMYNGQFKNLYIFIYAFHMPLFVFLSGYLAKRVKLSKVINFLFLYLIFQTFFNWFKNVLGQFDGSPFQYETPQYHLWYLVSMVGWYLIALLLTRVKVLSKISKWKKYIVIFILCFFSRWFVEEVYAAIRFFYRDFDTYTLSYQRTITFAPFFFAGFYMSKGTLMKLYSSINNVKIKFSLISVVSLISFILFQNDTIIENAFRGSYGFEWFIGQDGNMGEYLATVGIQYFISFLLCYILMNLISSKRSVLTKWGDNSLAIFLFHPIFVFSLWQFELLKTWDTDTKLIFFIFVSVGITLFLGTNMFSSITKYVCNPNISAEKMVGYVKLFKRKITTTE